MDPVDATPCDPVFELELRIARRADILAQAGRLSETPVMDFWIRAETEVLGVAFDLPLMVGAARPSNH